MSLSNVYRRQRREHERARDRASITRGSRADHASIARRITNDHRSIASPLRSSVCSVQSVAAIVRVICGLRSASAAIVRVICGRDRLCGDRLCDLRPRSASAAIVRV